MITRDTHFQLPVIVLEKPTASAMIWWTAAGSKAWSLITETHFQLPVNVLEKLTASAIIWWASTGSKAGSLITKTPTFSYL